jgi:hypothetical protein
MRGIRNSVWLPGPVDDPSSSDGFIGSGWFDDQVWDIYRDPGDEADPYSGAAVPRPATAAEIAQLVELGAIQVSAPHAVLETRKAYG